VVLLNTAYSTHGTVALVCGSRGGSTEPLDISKKMKKLQKVGSDLAKLLRAKNMLSFTKDECPTKASDMNIHGPRPPSISIA